LAAHLSFQASSFQIGNFQGNFPLN
jgi:hypothetical protein